MLLQQIAMPTANTERRTSIVIICVPGLRMGKKSLLFECAGELTRLFAVLSLILTATLRFRVAGVLSGKERKGKERKGKDWSRTLCSSYGLAEAALLPVVVEPVGTGELRIAFSAGLMKATSVRPASVSTLRRGIHARMAL